MDENKEKIRQAMIKATAMGVGFECDTPETESVEKIVEK